MKINPSKSIYNNMIIPSLKYSDETKYSNEFRCKKEAA